MVPWLARHGGKRRLGGLLLLAAVLLLLNAVKPLHMDDVVYYADARQIARQPLDPYGFQLSYFGGVRPALHVLAPPVVPFWWALGIRLFGTHPMAWKLWLWPFALLLVFALDALAR